jgi:guanylate kinase
MNNWLDVARVVVSEFDVYDYVVINDQLESCVERFRALVLAERARRQCMRPKALEILKTFQR